MGFFSSAWSIPASAERSTFAAYGFDQGLLNLGGTSLAEDPAGDLLISTESGVFAYDGRRFVDLGVKRGLRRGGEVFAVAVASTGRVAIEYPDEVYVSSGPSDASHPVTSLIFKPVSHPAISFYDERPHRLASWGSDFILLAGDSTVRVVVPPQGPVRAEAMAYDRGERALLLGAAGVFTVDGQLWETFADGRVCRADPGFVKCYSSADGLTQGQSFDLVGGADGEVLARTATSVSSFDPASRRWESVALPDQGGRYDAYSTDLGFYRAPDGSLLTQSVRGLDVLGPTDWCELTVDDGAPSGTIVDAMTDRTGELWFHVLGRGLVRWVGYGHWDTLEKSDGLSDGYPWETERSRDGALWVTTDDGLDEFIGHGLSRRLKKVFPGSSYALAATASGNIWAGYRDKGVRVISALTGSSIIFSMPAVETIVPAEDHSLWLGTTSGLYRVTNDDVPPFKPLLVEASRSPIPSIKPDGRGGIYYLGGGRLHHRHRDGTDVTVSGRWPVGELQPIVMAIAPDGAIWVGGTGGLYRLIVAGDRVVTVQSMPVEDTRTNTTYAIMVDHRGWIWFGTDLGITVFNGKRWVSADTDQGLLSNGVSEDGIREDPDGSVWIATDRGVSHLRDPNSLFVNRPLDVVVTGATLGSRSVERGPVPYNHDPLVVELGTPNHSVERSVQFRYRLSGVDAAWVISTSGVVRYPFVPPGRHVLTVIGDDLLTHRQSQPTELTIRVGYPWWRQWWAECLWAAATVAGLYGVGRFRYRVMYARQSELKRRIAEATAQIRHQAAHDQLTGLLIRSEVERRLAEKLKSDRSDDDYVVALLDIDHFKGVNDSYGHLGGDDVLRAFGRIITTNLRDQEFAGRYGGEEALLILNDVDGCAAERILDLHLSVRHGLFKAGDQSIRVTCSIGVAWVSGSDSWETLIGRADAALYDAKRGGRDQVVERRHRSVRVTGTT